MLGSDFCPYCNHEINPEDIFETSEVSGNETDESVECPNCGKSIRASLEPILYVYLSSEEDHFSWLNSRKESLEERLENNPDERFIDFYKSDLKQINGEIEESREIIKNNEELEE
ncbi:hypothetical protein NH286_03305 [Anaerococcus sp. NML200574]|uniref:hypothetical protein n=1 Tax=Anaerococcus sp. NML200574 TaxID=2954486 RepID=UPI002237D096|nr:hypothetical protein [Anaerococcus sp. NML200574]MCW6678180.1 hypothetical protein [Anaerococcus sp. NML200574]